MSRVGKKPIKIPQKVSITLSENMDHITVAGPKGELHQSIDKPVHIEITDEEVYVTPKSSAKNINAHWGLYRALIQNMVVGVTEGFTKKLRIEGVGYRVVQEGQALNLSLGYSHIIRVEPPEGVTFEVEKNIITVSGINKTLVGQVAADIRSKRTPEPYKGKGVRYDNEVVRMKVGKKAGS